jgi:hypothetical protein
MFTSVQNAFRAFSEKFEGSIPYMYLDVKGLVTTGIGNLVDPAGLALALPFRFKNKPGIATPGAPAMASQIAAEWQRLKSDPSLGEKGARACGPLTDLELSDDAISSLVLSRLTSNETLLKEQPWFQDFEAWPADAQLGLLSMAWAMGPAEPGRFPKFRAACRSLDFSTAAAECKISVAGIGGSLIARNEANFTLFSNAAIVLGGAALGAYQPSVLYYPQALQEAGGVSAPPPTNGSE